MVPCWVDGVGMRRGGAGVEGPEVGIRGISMMRSGRRGVGEGERFRDGVAKAICFEYRVKFI